ncbi:uncharacterized protein LOC124354554 isoform X2 [Homalodisca vitripennis]|uniref:uncharacterized protein LOC124354554 isoform X2 n=1 Tax=Homalodisca vitripennis TaxID=197043 RepID=UPI001EEB4DED|nr:uncharacterized protein LOC124354554 isoform X2 [Homalodisca vitripennis]XP_046661059.1 uncharacterized protein LOC124354554 isoform X2 [Homalodisca vitripennis]XP_046661060.1 uncharacterized protein LOC124354554 isoform X2 [Homalodisca vitripennis]
MLSPVVVYYVSFACCMSHALESGSHSDAEDEPNSFDKFFPDLTTETSKDGDIPVYKMYRWRNHPTMFTQPPPPRFSRERPTRSTTTEEPDDGEGDYKIIPVPKVATNGHPFLDKKGKRIKKITKRETGQHNELDVEKEEILKKSQPELWVWHII